MKQIFNFRSLIIILVMTISIIPFQPVHTVQAVSTEDCGKINIDHIPLGSSGTPSATAQELEAAKCMTKNILTCTPALVVDQFDINNQSMTIKGPETDKCLLSLGAWGPDPEYLCKIPQIVMTDLYKSSNYSADDWSIIKDYFFHVYILGGSIISAIPGGTVTDSNPKYKITCQTANGSAIPTNQAIGTTPAPSTPTTQTLVGDAHSVGTNVLFPDGVIYRIVAGPNRAAYTSANIFLSYKFNKWKEVVKANSGDLALSVTSPMPPRDGALLNDKGTIYIISEGKARQPFGTAAVFKGYGYSFKNAYTAGTGYLETYPAMTSVNLIHPDGTLIKNKGTYYIMNSHQRLGVPSLAVLDSWGYWLAEAVEANSYDLQASMGGVLGARPFEQYRY